MAKLADAADLKSADLYRSWGFKSPSGHHIIKKVGRKSDAIALYQLRKSQTRAGKKLPPNPRSAGVRFRELTDAILAYSECLEY
jgi:hypothetical protein